MHENKIILLLFQGVYNLDSLFEFSREAESQTVEESWSELDSGLVHRIVTNKARGDFLLTIGRNMETDTSLALTLAKHLRTNTAHHLKVNSTLQFMMKNNIFISSGQ